MNKILVGMHCYNIQFVCYSLKVLFEMLPPAIHSFSERWCHDNPHVTGYKHTTSLQGFGLGKAQTGITHTFLFFLKKPRFRDDLFCTRCIEPTSQFYHVATNTFI